MGKLDKFKEVLLVFSQERSVQLEVGDYNELLEGTVKELAQVKRDSGYFVRVTLESNEVVYFCFSILKVFKRLGEK